MQKNITLQRKKSIKKKIKKKQKAYQRIEKSHLKKWNRGLKYF